MTTIWHNPRCSKSRQTLQLLKDQGIEPTIRLYLEDPPTVAEIEEAVALLGSVEPLVRSKEEAFGELGLEGADRQTLIGALATHPRLIERPLVIHEGRAALGRPPERVLALLDS